MTNRSDPERMRELGRRGGKASGEARRKRRKRSVLDALRGRVSSNPDEFVGQLLATPAGAVRAAAMLERFGFSDEPEPGEVAPADTRTRSFRDLVSTAYRLGLAEIAGLPTTHAELDALLATEGEGAGQESKNHAPRVAKSSGVAIVGTSRPEAEVVLTVIEAWTPERLRELATSLREFVGRAA